MSFTKLEKDISYVSSLPDTPTLENGYTPEMLKAAFDKAGNEIKEFINTQLIDELEKSGAKNIGTEKIETVSGNTVQEILISLAAQIQDIANLSIPEGTITPEKFTPKIASFITNGSPKYKLFSVAGEYSFTPTRSGTYKITVVGAGGGGSAKGIYASPCGGGSGASTTGWLSLEEGHTYTVKIGNGGNPVTLNPDKKLAINSQAGESSSFYDGDTELMYAEGGITGMKINSIPTARGGIICHNGGLPISDGDIDNTTVVYKFGAPSVLGSFTASQDSVAVMGAGGHGASCGYEGVYTYPGGKGGDGAVLIEWVE